MFNQTIQTNNTRSLLVDNQMGNQDDDGATIGNYRGQRVVNIPSIHNSILGSLEELTTTGASRGERSLALSDRKVRDGGSRNAKLEELISRYLKKVPDIEKNEKIKDLAARMAGGNITNILDMQYFLNQFSEEQSHQYLALTAVGAFLKDRPESQHLAQLVAQAINNIEQDSQKIGEINTEIRISETANEFSKNENFSQLQLLRNFYRDTVHGYQGIQAVFNDVINRFGESGIPKAIDFLLKGMSSDLSVHGSSIEPTKLQLLMSDMHILKTVNTVQEQVSQLHNRFAPKKAGYVL